MKKLIAIQNELKVPKSNFNSFGKYYYRSCEDIIEALKPLCEKHEVLLFLSDTVVEVGGRVYVKATVTLKDGTDSITVDGWARESETKKGMDDSQITGTASSYARKYALNGLFLIDDTKDSDTEQFTTEQVCTKLSQAGNLDELKNIFTSLPRNLQTDAEVVAMKDELKEKLATK